MTERESPEVALLLVDVIEGFFSDITAADENCGTASTTELTWAVTARRVDDPVLARQEAQR